MPKSKRSEVSPKKNDWKKTHGARVRKTQKEEKEKSA